MEVMVSFMPRPLYFQRKSPWYPLDRRLGGSQSRSGHGGEEKNSHPLPGFELLIIHSVAQRCTSELSRLLPESIAEVKNAWSYKSTPPYVFIAWSLVKHRRAFQYESAIKFY
jgi:hypothetical protein